MSGLGHGGEEIARLGEGCKIINEKGDRKDKRSGASLSSGALAQKRGKHANKKRWAKPWSEVGKTSRTRQRLAGLDRESLFSCKTSRKGSWSNLWKGWWAYNS